MKEMFSVYDTDARRRLYERLSALIRRSSAPPVIMCIGSDRVTGDCLGPLTGHLLVHKYNIGAFVYGTLETPLTALNLEECYEFIKSAHPKGKIVAVDAALGQSGDVGAIRVKTGGIYPGAAVNKRLPLVGDIAITAVVGCSDFPVKDQLVATRLSFVMRIAEIIAAAATDCIN